MAATLGTLTPFRYRGYIYDEETGFYYLRSRYYYPNRGRFINADSIVVGNMFAYCNNSPIVAYDSNGTTSKIIINEMEVPEEEGKYYINSFCLLYKIKTGKSIIVYSELPAAYKER